MWDGYFNLGGLEVGNTARALAYTRGAGCPLMWLKGRECGGIADALGDDAYAYETINTAPWYDPDDEASARFLGAYVISMEGLSDSTRTATVTEKILDGAQVGAVRDGSREVRVRLMLSARGMDALELGMAWLKTVTSGRGCGAHGVSCGASNLEFFVSCPPAQGADEPEVDYNARVDNVRRYLHTVTCISGPFVSQEMVSNDGVHVGRIVEMTFVAATPQVFGVTRMIAVPPSVAYVVQDTPYNLEPYPSAEIAEGTAVVGRNYITNPSVEVDLTGWISTGPAVTAATRSTSRTNELAAAGAYSYLTRLLGNGAGGATNVETQNIIRSPLVNLADMPLGAKPSFSVWAAGLIISGQPAGTSIVSIVAEAEWSGSAGEGSGVVGYTPLTRASGEIGGGVYEGVALEVPAGATGVRIMVTATVKYTSSATASANSDIRVYVDAAAVMVP